MSTLSTRKVRYYTASRNVFSVNIDTTTGEGNVKHIGMLGDDTRYPVRWIEAARVVARFRASAEIIERIKRGAPDSLLYAIPAAEDGRTIAEIIG